MHLENKTSYAMSWIFSLQLTFLPGIGFAHTGRYKPKTKRVCTLFKSSGSIYFLHKQLSRKELHKDAAESWKVWLTYATAFSKTKRSEEKNYAQKKKTMSIILNHLYIRSKGLCDLKTLYYQTRQISKRVAVSVRTQNTKYMLCETYLKEEFPCIYSRFLLRQVRQAPFFTVKQM